MSKSTKYGIIGAIVFYILITFILDPLGMLITPGGDQFILSYTMFSNMGIVALCGVIIACTVKIINKIDELIIELRKNK